MPANEGEKNILRGGSFTREAKYSSVPTVTNNKESYNKCVALLTASLPLCVMHTSINSRDTIPTVTL